jgi:zona occludens toxin (predicted ATPase)
MQQLKFKRDVIANFPINLDLVSKNGKKRIGRFTYLKNDELTVEYLTDYARDNHKVGKEGQTIVMIDEAGTLYNSREYNSSGRKAWLDFFATHRHYGYDIILISQHPRQIDSQVRYKIEYDVKHRKANNYKMLGFILTLMRIPTFVAVTYWYGMNERCSGEFFRYRKRDSKLYDTMMLFGGDNHGESIGIKKDAQDPEQKNLSDNNEQNEVRMPELQDIVYPRADNDTIYSNWKKLLLNESR